MVEGLLGEIPIGQREPLVVRESSVIRDIRSTREKTEFVLLASTGYLSLVTDTNGRSAPADREAVALGLYWIHGGGFVPGAVVVSV
jgi:hypothetical protein